MASGTRKKAATDELGSIIRELGDIPSGLDGLLGAATPQLAAPEQTNESPSAAKANPKPPKRVRHPCGKCDAEVTGNSICCNSCELWYHFGCVEGMSKEYFDNCEKIYRQMGYSAFLCKVCRKVLSSVKKSLKDVKEELKALSDKIVVLEMEKVILAQKLEKIETSTEKVSDRVVGVEKEVASGMEKAKEEVKKVVQSEMADQEERGCNVVVYGLEETKEDDTAQWKAKEQKKVEDLIQKMGVQVQGGISIKYRAGRPRADGARPRPVIIKVDDDETRVSIFRNAPRLSRMDETKRVYIAPDLTPSQQEEDKKNEAKLKEDALRKTEESKNGGGEKRFVVVGARGKRRVVEADERAPRRS